MISRIIKVQVRVISRSRRLRLITLTSTLIILDITKTSSNNCLLAPGGKELRPPGGKKLRERLGEFSRKYSDVSFPYKNVSALRNRADTACILRTLLSPTLRFVDGTVRPIARPDEHQRILYNGHKLVHAFKFHSVALPHGKIGNLFGQVGKSKMFLCFYFLSFLFLFFT